MGSDGIDRTEEFIRGARLALELAQKEAQKRDEDLELAILKSKSPSCGMGEIYDGSFQHRLTQGAGLFARLLLQQQIWVVTEERISGNTIGIIQISKEDSST